MTFMNKNYKKISIVIIIIGIILRMIYISYTTINERQHDMENARGHLAYINEIYETGKLPSDNRGQFYHPPLHHIISAGFLKLQTSLNIEIDDAKENLQILTVIYSSIILITIFFILNRINIKNIYKLIVLLIMAVYPTFIILSGSINNDVLSIMFEFLIILYLLKWYEDSSIKNTIILGIFTALALLTKVSTIMMGVPIAAVFLDKFILEFCKNKKETIKKYLIRFLIFGLISIGIGFIYIFRNMILFGQKPLYVLKVVNLLYCGNASFIERCRIFSPELIKQTYCAPYENCNIFSYIVKCSMFGEYRPSIETYNFIAEVLKWTNVFLIFISILAIIKLIIRHYVRRKKNNNTSIVGKFLIIYFVIIAAYIYGVFSMPYGCTMDFRYIVPTAFLGIILMYIDLDESQNEKYYKIYRNIIYILSVIFIITSFISIFTLTKFLTLVQ